MGRRQQQHLGRSTEEPGDIPGRDHRQDPVVHDETVAKIEEAKGVSRAIDQNEGYDRGEPGSGR